MARLLATKLGQARGAELWLGPTWDGLLGRAVEKGRQDARLGGRELGRCQGKSPHGEGSEQERAGQGSWHWAE